MERQSGSNSLENIRISYIGKNIEQDTTDNVKIKREKTSLIKQCLIDYTANTNLHGLKYVGEKERTTVENLDIPYPAVTLCPEMKVMQTVFNYTEHYHLKETNPNTTEEPDHLFEDVSLICNKNVAPWIRGRTFSLGNKTVENIKKVSPTIHDIMGPLMWKDKIFRSSDLFSPILTEEGYCYTFNTIGADELFRIENLNTDYNYYDSLNKSQSWTLENGYLPNTPLETYPHRGTGYGENAGLLNVLRASEKDFDYLCSGPTQGYKIILHNPAEFPKLSQHYFRIPLERDVVVAVKPKMMTTSNGLKPYSPVRRQWYFSSERYLNFFKVYTQANCETECLTNFTYARCGCVHFGMPLELVTVEIQNNLKEATNADDTIGEAHHIATNCKCLPACTSIEYEAETSQADFNVYALLKAMNSRITETGFLYTQIKIFFKEAQFIKVRRSELYGHTDFLANCGGLLGLFLGFSLLSVVEFIYFFTLR
ncbi:pickpocket protein 28-like [Melitaea cinxia]|uniref:pickpocket protein 28-like n=1 Tax=Melitaea cinxia TaxID=113334 RepID=UPI001E272F53|nr:pickpocket protein 28-like [Melitaea cinxia]